MPVKKALITVALCFCLLFSACGSTLHGTDELIEKAREEFSIADAENMEIRYAGLCNAGGKRFEGGKHPGFVERRLVSIERNQHKCILCNLCVRTCEEEVKAGILGLVGRGFETVIKPEFRDSAAVGRCRECRRCVEVCPTGALKLLADG